jgi:hypothetical protein
MSHRARFIRLDNAEEIRADCRALNRFGRRLLVLQDGLRTAVIALARIIHKLSAATADTFADTALRSAGRLDVWPYTPW